MVPAPLRASLFIGHLISPLLLIVAIVPSNPLPTDRVATVQLD
jgi:hypothetical protein